MAWNLIKRWKIMRECIYKNKNYKIMFAYDGYQVWEKVSKRHDIWCFVVTFPVLAQAVKYIESDK